MHSEFANHLWQQIKADPKKIFWQGPDYAHSYDDLTRAICEHCGRFDSIGLESGQPLVIVSNDDWVASTLWIAAVLDGKVPSIIAPDSSEDRLVGIAELIKPSLIVADTERCNQPWAESDSWVSFFTNNLPNAEKRDPSLKQPESGLAYLLFTSGTTSQPKGVMLTHTNLQTQLAAISRVWELERRSKIFNGLVTYHTDGLVQGPVLTAFNGATLLRPDAFSLNRLEQDLCWLRDSRATHMISAPTVYALIDRHAARSDYFDRSEFKTILTTSAPMAPDLWDRLEERFKKPIVNEYGMTETVAASHFAGPHAEMGERYTIGKPIDCEAIIVDPSTGKEQPQGEVGELCLRGPYIFAGYFGRPEETEKAFRGEWFRTGDLATVTPRGNFSIVGRMSTAINSGGFLIRPEEIDEVLLKHPDVLEAQTVGVSDEDFGALPVSAIVPQKPLEQSDILEFCRTKLERQKVPKKVVFLKELPRRGSGKVDLPALKEILQNQSTITRDINSEHDAVILDIAAEVFGAKKGSLNISFGPDQIGGWDSYSHTVLVMEVEAHFDIQISMSEINNIETLQDLSNTVARQVKAPDTSEPEEPQDGPLEVLRSGTGGITVIAMPDLFGVPLWINKILPFIDDRCEVLGLRPNTEMLRERDNQSIAEYAQECARIILGHGIFQPTLIVGYSFGGFLSYETANILKDESQNTVVPVLLDSAVPSRLRRKRFSDKIEWHARIMAWRFRSFRRVFVSVASTKGEVLDEPGLFPVALSSHPASIRATVRQFYNALSRYEPSYYKGTICLLRATKRRSILGPSPNLSWDVFASEVDQYDINADHRTILFDDASCQRTATEINNIVGKLTKK